MVREKRCRLLVVVKQAFLAFMNGAMPQIALEHGRKTISAYDRPSIDSATIRVARDTWFDGVRPTPTQVAARIAPAGHFRGLVLAWATLRAWQRDTGLG